MLYYEVLIQISLGYPSVKGRLHTRYAPVRRSLESKLSIPLDLHVLSLPLAFILSQDQTLHRILCETISCLFNYATPILSVFSNLLILLLLFFCSNLMEQLQCNVSTNQNGCQFNMSRNVFLSCFSLY